MNKIKKNTEIDTEMNIEIQNKYKMYLIKFNI